MILSFIGLPTWTWFAICGAALLFLAAAAYRFLPFFKHSAISLHHNDTPEIDRNPQPVDAATIANELTAFTPDAVQLQVLQNSIKTRKQLNAVRESLVNGLISGDLLVVSAQQWSQNRAYPSTYFAILSAQSALSIRNIHPAFKSYGAAFFQFDDAALRLLQSRAKALLKDHVREGYRADFGFAPDSSGNITVKMLQYPKKGKGAPVESDISYSTFTPKPEELEFWAELARVRIDNLVAGSKPESGAIIVGGLPDWLAFLSVCEQKLAATRPTRYGE